MENSESAFQIFNKCSDSDLLGIQSSTNFESCELPFQIFNYDYDYDLLELSDGKLLTDDGHVFKIHKIELAKKSNYFYRLFCGKSGREKTEFLIPGVAGECLRRILSYLYTGNVDINEDNACDLLVAADYLLLEDLILCIKKVYMTRILDIRNCLSLFMTALHIDRKDILSEVFRFIQTRFESVVAVSNSEIGELPLDALTLFLVNKNLCVRDESVVWLAISKWVRTDFSSRQRFVPDLLMYLTVSEIDEHVAAMILDSSIVKNNPSCKEISKLQQSSSFESNLEILLTYMQMRPNPVLSFYTHRLPEHVYFVAHYCVHNQTDGVHIYVTYDEEIDLWRKVVEIDICPDYILSIGHKIFLFKTSENSNLYYDLIEKEWNELLHFRVLRNFYGVVHLDGLIYVLGGISVHFGHGLNEVEVYDPCENRWFDVAPMLPVNSFNAVTARGRIYVVGTCPAYMGFEMIAQMYSTEYDEWKSLKQPSIYRFKFAFVAYNEKVYMIGGRNEDMYLTDVEVFDPETEQWGTHENLPYIYYVPKAIVINDKLIVYDSHLEDRSYLKTSPAVEWDEHRRYWKPFNDYSPMNAVHEYCFFVPNSRECIKTIATENKDPKTRFFKSIFH